jgi:hypothetical protein
VLLILAGVTISMLFGKNGIINQAQMAKEQTEIANEKEGVGIAVNTSRIGEEGYEELNQTSLQKAINEQFGAGKAIVRDNGDDTFTVSFAESKREYNITESGVENGINWNTVMANAKAPESQDEERNNGVIGIGTDGNPVDMDLWEYVLLDDDTYCLNDIKDLSGGSSTWSNGYIGEYNEDGTIIGEVPQYISTDGKNFKPVTSMLMTFYNCTSLAVQPKLPTTVTKLEYTFWNCTNLVTINKIHNGVTTMEGIYMVCTSIVEIPELPNTVTNLTSAFAKTNISVAPKIPDSVTNMTNTFGNCVNLMETPYIPDSVVNFGSTFKGCTKLEKVTNIPQKTTTLSHTFFGCTDLKSIPNEISNTVTDMTSTFQDTGIEIAPDIPNSVTSMNHTFRECHNLTTVNKISNNAETMNCTFYNCYLLEGDLEINANPTNYGSCFAGCSINSPNNLVLKGSSEVLNELLNTKSSKSKIAIE